ncbi:MAG: hypothetical protein QM820_02555 [Minicystis sp.]
MRTRSDLPAVTKEPSRRPAPPVAIEPRESRLLAAPPFHALRDLLRAFSRGGMPSRASRTPEEDARLVVFQTLNELVHLLDQFRRRAERGEPVRLLVKERGRQMGRAVVEIAIVGDGDLDDDPAFRG